MCGEFIMVDDKDFMSGFWHSIAALAFILSCVGVMTLFVTYWIG